MGLFVPVFQLVEKRFMTFTVEATFTTVQRHQKRAFLLVFERVQMALQR